MAIEFENVEIETMEFLIDYLQYNKYPEGNFDITIHRLQQILNKMKEMRSNANRTIPE